MNKRLTTFLIGVACATSATASEGESAETKEVNQLNSIVVTATKNESKMSDLPVATSVLTSDEISDLNETNVYDLLEWLPGVGNTSNPTDPYNQPTIRGLSGSSVIVTVDGVNKTVDSNKGMSPSPLDIDPFLLEQIEVVKGSSSALYGSGGIGGVIALRTKSVADLLEPGKNLGGFVRSYYSKNYDEIKNTGGFYGITKNNQFDWLLTGTLYDSDFSTSQRKVERDTHQITAKLGWNIDYNQRLAVKVADNRSDYTAEGLIDPDKLVNNSYQVTYDNEDGDNLNLKTSLSLDKNKREASMANPLAGQQDSEYDRFQFDIQNTQYIESGKSLHTLTYAFNHQTLNQSGTVNGEVDNFIAPEGKRTDSAVFIQDRFDWDKLTFIGALRYNSYKMSADDQVDVVTDNLLPNIGMTLRATDWLSVYANYSKNFRAPTIDELYTRMSRSEWKMEIIPNPDLKPEKSDNRELGFTLHGTDLFFSNDSSIFKVTYFDQDIKDMITSSKLGTDPVTGFDQYGSINIGEVKRRGAEIEAAYQKDQLTLGLAADYIDAEDKQTGDDIDGTPKTLKLKVGYEIPEIGLNMTWLAKAADKRKDGDEISAGYMTHDINTKLIDVADIKGLELTAGITNLFDKEYRSAYGYEGQERNYKLNIAYKL